MKNDIKDLESGKLTYSQENCYKYRIGEKALIHYFIDTAQSLLPLFEEGITLKKAKEVAFNNPDYENLKVYMQCSVFTFLR